MPSDSKTRPRWHLIYYALAAFDLIAVSSSLYLNHEIMDIYGRSVEVNQKWANRLNDLTVLSELAQNTNAPGNNVFDTKDVVGERAARDNALLKFNNKFREFHWTMERNAASRNQHILQGRITDIQGAMDKMVEEADEIFRHFENGQGELAGRRMARMDYTFHELTRNIMEMFHVVFNIQAENFKAQIADANALRWFEFLIGGAIFFMVVGVTIYGHKIAQAMRRHDRQLNEAKREAESANEAKSVFLANMTHELRTPLNAVIGFSDIMKNQMFGPLGSSKYRQYAEDINHSALHLLDLINDNLDLSKMESGLEDIHAENFEITEVIGTVQTLVKESASKAGLEIVWDVPSNLPPIHADKRKLKQILVNLLTNAIKFTEVGGKVTCKAWCQANDGFVFQVIDSGVGVAPKDIPKVLSRFGQIDGTYNREQEGTGLGLPLTKSLVELHGGSLDFQSELGVGTTVTIRLPATYAIRLPSETQTLPLANRMAA